MDFKKLGGIFLLCGVLAHGQLDAMKRSGDDLPSAPKKKRTKKSAPEAPVSVADPRTSIVSKEKSLMQGSTRGHKLHCGYYALWNAVCSIDAAMLNKHTDKEAFTQTLRMWENHVRASRNPGGIAKQIFGRLFGNVLSLGEVDNLEPDEIIALIKHFYPVLQAQITVVCSQSQLRAFCNGHGLTDELIARINRYKNDRQSQVFIVNTACDMGENQKGTGHFFAIIVLWLDDKWTMKIYNSASHRPDSDYIENFCKPLEQLLVTEPFQVLVVRSKLCPISGQLARYLDPRLQDEQSWLLVRAIEDYFIELNLAVLRRNPILVGPQGDFDAQVRTDLLIEIKTALAQIRIAYDMEPDSSKFEGAIAQGYAAGLCAAIDEVFARIAEKERDAVRLQLHNGNYAYCAEGFRRCAVRLLRQAFDQARTIVNDLSPQVFEAEAGKFGVIQEVIQQVLEGGPSSSSSSSSNVSE